MTKPKVAIVHDWLTNMGGAEKVVLAFHEAFPDAPIYTSTYNPDKTPAFSGLDVRTTYLQKLPRSLRNLHKFMPFLRVHAFRSLDLSEYDVILSSSSAESKQVRKTREDQVHICYCHTPIRYYWSHYAEYRADPGFGRLNWLLRLVMPLIVPSQKRADYTAAQSVDYFIGNSTTVAKRIETYYNRQADVLFPPVETTRFKPAKVRADYYVSIARHIPYKRLDLAIAAANKLGVKLRVFGNGSERRSLEKLAGPTVSFYEGSPSVSDQKELTDSLNNAKAFIFPAEEDFGIVQVEAMAAGAPVIAYKVGGASDIVIDNVTGVLFAKQTPEDVARAVAKVESSTFDPEAVRNHALTFDTSLFVERIKKYVADHYRL